jgi:hypothetical protein
MLSKQSPPAFHNGGKYTPAKNKSQEDTKKNIVFLCHTVEKKAHSGYIK